MLFPRHLWLSARSPRASRLEQPIRERSIWVPIADFVFQSSSPSGTSSTSSGRLGFAVKP